jgi:hypothetical protein
VKAESRRLMLGNIITAKGKTVQKTFVVDVPNAEEVKMVSVALDRLGI